MEAKLRIIEISPKLKNFKNNSKDIISISFISDNYSVKIEDVDKAIINNEKIIINIKESKNKILPIKYSLIRNNNNIIASGEFIPCEGINWYKLNDVKNNLSKESLTSSTSNGNVRNNYRFDNISDSNNNSYGKETTYIYNPKSNLKSSLIIKIKFSINFLSKAKNSRRNIKKNNKTKEGSVYSSKDDDNFFDKENEYDEDDFFVTESKFSKFNPKNKLLTTLKKTNQKLDRTEEMTKRPKKKINFNITQSPIFSNPQFEDENINENRTILSNNSKSISPIRKNTKILNRRLLNEDKRLKTSVRFKKKNEFFETHDIISDDEFKDKKISEIYRNVKSCRNIEDEIFDQNLQNYLKNDEILKDNISKNNSFTSSNQNNINLKDKELDNNYYIKNNELTSQATRINDNNDNQTEKENENKDKKFIPQDLNTNSLYSDFQFFKSGSDFEYAISNNDSLFKNIIMNNDNNENNNINKNKENNDYSFEEIDETNIIENYEKLKTDFLLLYSKTNLSSINNDMLFFEIQLMIEKMLALQYEHQKVYINLNDCISSTKNILNNYQYQYILKFKQINKLQGKKLYHETLEKRKTLYNENFNNFIDTRKTIINKSEFKIWDEMMSNTNKTAIKNNYKNKMTNIFLNICEKNENHLNKLSLKFYNEIKNKKSNNKIINNVNNVNKGNKKNKYNKTFSERKVTSVKSRIKANETEQNCPQSPNLKTNRNIQNNYRVKSNKEKFMLTKKTTKKMKTTDNYGTMINEFPTQTNFKKKYNLKNKSSNIADTIVRKKRGINKSQ